MRSRLYFTFFLVSGFCSLVYETVWLRLAMAAFGVTTASISIVVSVFMGGLALGSWIAGRLVESRGTTRSALRLYAAAELLIGCSGLLVPQELDWGHRAIVHLAASGPLSSPTHYVASAALTTLALLPWCLCMGATFPLAMAAMRAELPDRRSFSYLYVANVVGATAGTLLTAYVLVELLGFRHTLTTTALLNLVLAATAGTASFAVRGAVAPTPAGMPQQRLIDLVDLGDRGILVVLFATGFVSMALEVVWIRQYTPFLGTVVYAFAKILACYLAATFVGSTIYRLWTRARAIDRVAGLCAMGGGLALLTLFAADPSLGARHVADATRLIIGIAPFSALLGFLTPLLVDRFAAGGPRRTGRAYAINALGCIVGPLVAGFGLLPRLGERGSTIVLAAPLVAAGALVARRAHEWLWIAAAATVAFAAITQTRGFEQMFPAPQVRRDDTATVIATGSGMRKRLLVNGVGMTSLTPITKMMAHLPLAIRSRPPQSGLVICFGMGTSFRSMRSWGIPTTAVELVPSVPALFGYYHPDGPALFAEPGARVVIDDGRRFLARTADRYDVIVVDPPPPVAAASSSLLYSREFYRLARTKLRPGGILQQWLPGGDAVTIAAVHRALADVFAEVRVFRSIEGWGLHFLASEEPLGALDASRLAARLPDRARADLLEWGPFRSAEEQLSTVVRSELPLGSNDAPALADDRPVNEYDWLRRHVDQVSPYLRQGIGWIKQSLQLGDRGAEPARLGSGSCPAVGGPGARP